MSPVGSVAEAQAEVLAFQIINKQQKGKQNEERYYILSRRFPAMG